LVQSRLRKRFDLVRGALNPVSEARAPGESLAGRSDVGIEDMAQDGGDLSGVPLRGIEPTSCAQLFDSHGVIHLVEGEW